ncbi:MAG TPA: hypothetical protein VGK00_17115 [Anaerolineales bacterium]
MSALSGEQIQNAKSFIFKNGRLLERKLWEYFFENGSKQACLKALVAYQNPDGGFGNGIEPDILCPDSSAIGAEFAMHVLDLMGCQDTDPGADLIDWIINNQNEAGFIDHPPQNMPRYPHQPWWENPDRERILFLAGIMKKWGIESPIFFEKVSVFYQETTLPPIERYYGYPHFVYLKYCDRGDEDNLKLASMVSQLPEFLSIHRNHFPLLSRGWMYAREYVPEVVWAREKAIFLDSLQGDGGVSTPYRDLPWWRPIWTLNGFILLNKDEMDSRPA